MLNNTVAIALAIISLVCLYLIWQNFKQTAKIRYLEASIHETVQTVQGLVNNSLGYDNIQQQKDFQQVPQHPPQMLSQQSSSQSSAQATQPVQAPQQQTSTQQKDQSKQTDQIPQIPQIGGMFGSLLNNLIGKNSLFNMQPMNGIENDDENDGDIEEIDDEIDGDIEEIEPLEINDELKEQINNLEFKEPEDGQVDTKKETKDDEDAEQETEETEETESEQEVEELNIENLETGDLESVSGDFDDHIGLEEVSMVESTEPKEESKTEPKEESKTEAKDEPKEETKEEQQKEHKEEHKEEHNEDYLTNAELLNGMSLKQLRDIAEKYNLGSRGSKEQLLAKIKRNISMKN